MDDNRALTSGLTRRDALRRMGMLSVGFAAVPVPGWPEWWFRAEEVVVPFTDVPETFTGRRPGEERHPGQNRFAQDLRQLTEWTTPVEDYFVVTHYNVPELSPASWRLRIGGLVDRPLVLTLDDLRRRPRVERSTVFECGGNARTMFHGMVGNSRWAGAELLPILEEAGLTDDAREIHFWAADSGTEEIRGNEYEQNFARSMSLQQIRETNPILAYEQNGQPLTVVHGFPLRMIVPGWYGVAQVKWLERIEASADRLMTRFMAKDYVTLMGQPGDDGEVRWVETSVTRQRVKSAIARVTREDDRFRIFGIAFSDGTPLREVLVRIDDGDWRPATLDTPADPVTWTFFTLETTGLAPGEHTLVSRATDAAGRTQPDNLELKRTRWENNELFVRTIRVDG